jgi:hypothetical protein
MGDNDARPQPETASRAIRHILRPSASRRLDVDRAVYNLETFQGLEETALLRLALDREVERLLDGIDCRLGPHVRTAIATSRALIVDESVTLILRAPIELGSTVLQERLHEWDEAFDGLRDAKRRVANTWIQRRDRHGETELGQMQERAEESLLRIMTNILKEAREEDLPGAMTTTELESEIDAFILKVGHVVPAPGFIWALLNAVAGVAPVLKTVIPRRETIKKRLQRHLPD